MVQTVSGRHQIRIEKEGFQPFSTWVEAKENQTVNLTPILKEVAKPKVGTLVIEADVSDAEVLIEGN